MNKYISFVFIVVSFLLASCKDSNNSFTMGEELIDVKTDVISVDTFTIHSYTIQMDSVVTSGQGVALVGNYTDNDLEEIKASSFFELGGAGNQNLLDFSVYDSITLEASYSHYVYGDTTKYYTLEVRQLKEKLGDNISLNESRYNKSMVNYDKSEILGKKTFLPRPSKTETLSIRLNDVLGKDFFDLAMEEDDRVVNTDTFVKYFNGIALIPDEQSSSVLGFSADTSLSIKVYYHINAPGTGEVIVNKIKFPLNNSSLQFNHIETNRTAAYWNLLGKSTDVLPSSESGGNTYCQAGTGLMTKLEFPYLKKLLETNDKLKILKAELTVCPVKSSYKLIPLPTGLEIFQTDKNNAYSSDNYLGNGQGGYLTASLTIDEFYNEQTAYTYDVTSYIAGILKIMGDEVPALGVSVSHSSLNSTLNRVILGDQSGQINRPKLKVLFWRY